MNDFERALADALKKASDDYRPTDQYAAKERFLHRLHRRQRFFATGGVALAGAAAVIAGFLFFARDAAPERAEPLPPAVRLEGPLPDIQVGERPSGVAFGDGAVWVANSGDGTVMVIDPISREVVETIDVGGAPDDVAVGVGAAWVTDSGAGTIARVPLPSSGEPLEPVVFNVGEPGSTHMDVAPGADGLWIAKDESVFRVDPETNDVQSIPTVDDPTDVAVGEGGVYILGATEVARLDPVSMVATHLADARPSRNQDLGFRDGFLWLADGDAGEVTRIDPVTGGTSRSIFVGGNFSGISVDEGAVWVISGGASDAGVLTRIDPNTLAVREPRAELHGRPYDITTGAGFVWIANHSAGTVSGLHPAALPVGAGQPADVGRVVLTFAADGDIWVENFDGRLSPLIQTPVEERSPTLSPDGRHVAFERGPDNKAEGTVVVLDLDEGTETDLGRAWSPAFGPDGRLAWVEPTDEGDVQIVVGRTGDPDSVITRFAAIAGYGAPNDADHVTWDLAGDYLYYNAGWEGYSLYQAEVSGRGRPFELIPSNHEEFATYFAPSVRSDLAVHVVRVCCQEPGDVPRTEESLELGIIRFTEGGPAYQRVVDLDPRQIPVGDFRNAPDLDSAGNLTLEMTNGDRRWAHTVVRSWFVATDDDIWLIDARGRAVYVSDAMFNDLGDFSVSGLETAPEFDN